MITTYSCIHINHKKVKRFVLLIVFLSLFFTTNSFSQQRVQVTSVTPNPVCAGSAVSITFNAINGNGANKYSNSTNYNVFIRPNTSTSFYSIASFSTSGITYASGNGATTYGITTTITIPTATLSGTTYQIIITDDGWYYSDSISPNFEVIATTVSNAGTNQTVCATNTTLAGNTPTTGTGVWTLISGSGTITTPSSPTSTITGLGVGANVFRWTISNGVCPASSSDVTITRNATPTTSNAGTNQTVCATNTTLAGNTPTTGTGVWTLISGSGTIATPSSPSCTITGLGVGANVFRWTISNGVCTPSTSDVTITRNATPTAPTIGTITQTNCITATGSVVLNGLPATGTWTINPGAISGSGTSRTISGLTAGTYNYTVTNEAGCTSLASGNVVINTQPVALSAPTVGTITHPTCSTETGSVVLNGLPVSGNWILTRNPGGITTTGTGASTTISGLSAGTYTYTVTSAGTGLNADYFNNMTLSGSPTLTRTDATVNFDWGNGNPGAPINNDNFSARWSGQILPLYSETYTFTTRSDDGIRLWINGTQIINNWTDHAVTNNTGTITLVAGVKYDIVLEYYENGGQAVAQLSWNSASQTLQIIPQSQLFPTINCSSFASANVVINPQPATPTVTAASTSPTLCVNNALTNITHTTTVATGIGIATGLPTGVSAAWASNTITISGTPTVSGTFNYSIPLTGGCGTVSASGIITVNPLNTIATGINRTTCINTAITPISLATSGATGATFVGLPAGVSGSWTGNVVTISGTPLASGTFNYIVTTSGGCLPATTSGTIAVTPLNTIASGINRTTCINSAITTITLATTGATGATFAGLPAGVTGSWTGNEVTISGTPLASGTFNYTVTTSGGCLPATTSGTITVTPLNTIATGINRTTCINTAITPISLATSGATGATFVGLPAGVSGSWTGNVVTISGTPLASGTFNYTVTTSGGCLPAITSGTITVNPNNISFWTGVIDSDWNKSGNWRCDVLPTSIIDIIIPSVGVINFPIVTNDLIISNIDIQNGATVTVSNHELRINGILTLNGKIDLQNESQLIQSGTSTLVTSGCTGIIEIDQQGTSDNFKYNYWSSPVSSVCNTTNYTIAGVLRDGTFPNNIKNINYGAAYTYADVKVVPVDNPTTSIKLSTYWMYKYTNKSAGDYSAWTAIGNSGNLLAGEGFTLKGSNSTLPIQNYTFVGKPNNGDINLTITTGKQYLIGNPYPSALKADDFIKDNIKQYSKIDGTVIGGNRTSDIIDGNLYFWDHFGGGTHFLKSYEGGYSIYNLSGPTKAVSTDARIKVTSNESNKSAQKWIPVAQGFFVTAKDGGQIEFKNSQREYKKENINVSQFLKTTGKSSSKEQETSEDLTPRIYLKFSAPSGLHRQILTAIIPNTSDELDIGYDALNNETFSDDMSWATAAGKMVIQAVPTLDNERILPLEVKVSTTGIARISIDKLENISIKTALFLRDNTTGTLTNLKENVFEVNLNPGNYVNRFELILKTEQTLSVDDEKLPPNFISIYLDNTNHILYINKTSIVEIHKIDFYNIIGQLVFSSTKNEKTNSFNLPQDMQTGVYILKVKTDKGLVIKKLINP